MKLKKIILLTAMVALPSVGLSADQKKATAYSDLLSAYKLDSQPGHAICKLLNSEKKFDPAFTYYDVTRYDKKGKKTVQSFAHSSSLFEILLKHPTIGTGNCTKLTGLIRDYLKQTKTYCPIGPGSTLTLSQVSAKLNKDNDLGVNCGKITRIEESEDSYESESYDYCEITSKTAYADNENLEKMFTRDKCHDIKILNPKNEETGS